MPVKVGMQDADPQGTSETSTAMTVPYRYAANR